MIIIKLATKIEKLKMNFLDIKKNQMKINNKLKRDIKKTKFFEKLNKIKKLIMNSMKSSLIKTVNQLPVIL